MHFVESKHAQKEKITRRTMSSVMNLLLIASFIVAPTSIVLSPPLCIAAPLPVPTWMSKIIDNVKNGRLTPKDIDTLKTKSAGSYKTLLSIITRIDQLAAQQKSPFSLQETGILFNIAPNKVVVKVKIVNRVTREESDDYDLGAYTNDVRPMKKTSLQESMVDVTE